MNFKQQAAAEAASLIKGNSIVGLGAGSTIAYLAEHIKNAVDKGLMIQLVTSSFTTFELLKKYSLNVQTAAAFNEIDFYFDGCDQFDKSLNALKSGGGIHTQEKLLASMAKEFILIGDTNKLVEEFDTKYPVVLEVLPEAVAYVPHKIKLLFDGLQCIMRKSEKRDGPVITDNGNYLFDVYFKSWPNLSQINPALKSVVGIVETSLFYNLAHKAIIAGEKGVTVLNKE